MNGTEERLAYLEDTKSLIKDAINETGGTLTDNSAFDEYPEQVNTIIGNSIIPQVELDKFIEQSKRISGFRTLYGIWENGKHKITGLIDSNTVFVCPDNPNITATIDMPLEAMYNGGTYSHGITGEFPILIPRIDMTPDIGYRTKVTITNRTNKTQKVNFKLNIYDSNDTAKYIFSTFSSKYESKGYGPIEIEANQTATSYYVLMYPYFLFRNAFDEIDGNYYFTENTLNKVNTYLNKCDRCDLTFTSEEVS